MRVGLLTVLGGVGGSGLAVGGLALGAVAHGAAQYSLLTLTEPSLALTNVAAWLISSVALTIGGVALLYAWTKAANVRRPRRD